MNWSTGRGFVAIAFLAVIAPQRIAAQGGAPAPVSFGTPKVVDGATAQPIIQATDPVATPSRRVPLAAFWDYGLRFESANDGFRLHVGGSAQIDSTWFVGPGSVFALPSGGANGVGNASATFLRRARLRADGELYGLFDFVVEYDFANATNENAGDDPPSFNNLTGSPAPANVWMQIRDVPLLGNVRFGYQLKPIGMTTNTPQTNLPFLERPDITDAIYAPFDAGFSLGVSVINWSESERLTWRYGIFRPITNVFGVSLEKYAYGARVTSLPWFEDEGERLMHVGLGFWGGQVVQDKLRLRARPVLRNGPGFAVPVLVDTGQIPGSRQYTFAPEFAMALGPWTIQAEWAGQFLTQASAGGVAQGTVFFHGGYVEALYFLTGEHHAYVKRDGVFGRVVPRNDYYWRRCDAYSGPGAWQIGARFSYVNLNDNGIQGGYIYDWTLGLNWYLNPNMKLQFNYIAEHREGPTGTPVGWINGFGLRAAFDF